MHWVFAYGSNMHQPDLRRWLRENGDTAGGPVRVERARILGYELVWNYSSPSRRGGAANVRPCAGADLLGLALQVDDRLLEAIDRKEGHPQRYDRGTVPVTAELQAEAVRVDAWLYRVQPAYRSPGFVPPRAEYLALMVEAALEHRLGQNYVAELRQIPTVS